MDQSDLESSSDENDDDDDARTDADFGSEAGSEDEEDDFDLDIPSSSEDEASRRDNESDYEDGDDDVFGSKSASARKRAAKSGSKSSPSKRLKTGRGRGRSKYDNEVGEDIVLLKPSAATLRKNAALAERRQQRLAERQARRLQPRLPLVQQRYMGLEGVESNMTPFEKARAVLHVGCTPDYLPCRDEEYAEVEAYLEDAIDEGVGSCICELSLRAFQREELVTDSVLLSQTLLVFLEQARRLQCGVLCPPCSSELRTKKSSHFVSSRSTA